MQRGRDLHVVDTHKVAVALLRAFEPQELGWRIRDADPQKTCGFVQDLGSLYALCSRRSADILTRVMQFRCGEATLRIAWLICVIALAACTPPSSGIGNDVKNQPTSSHPDWQAISDEELVADSLDRHSLTRFGDYPAAIRRILQRWWVEHEICRGALGSASLRACNRRYAMHAELEEHGWCWGGGRFEAEMRWLRCVDDPSYEAGRYEAAGPPFSDLQVALAEHEELRLRAQPGPARLPALMAEFQRASTRALADPIDEAARRRSPLARYHQLPAATRPLAQRADIENQDCETGRAAYRAAGFRACNRFVYAEVELMRLGWCRIAAGAWVSCTSAHGTPDDKIASGHIYPESHIRWKEARERVATHRVDP